jgi:hypothetical protein
MSRPELLEHTSGPAKLRQPLAAAKRKVKGHGRRFDRRKLRVQHVFTSPLSRERFEIVEGAEIGLGLRHIHPDRHGLLDDVWPVPSMFKAVEWLADKLTENLPKRRADVDRLRAFWELQLFRWILSDREARRKRQKYSR